MLRTAAPRAEPVGWLQADGTHAAGAELLRDLGQDTGWWSVLQRSSVNLDRRVELWQRAARELDVDHRAGDGDDAAVLRVRFSVMLMTRVSWSSWCVLCGASLLADAAFVESRCGPAGCC